MNIYIMLIGILVLIILILIGIIIYLVYLLNKHNKIISHQYRLLDNYFKHTINLSIRKRSEINNNGINKKNK